MVQPQHTGSPGQGVGEGEEAERLASMEARRPHRGPTQSIGPGWDVIFKGQQHPGTFGRPPPSSTAKGPWRSGDEVEGALVW